MSRDLVETGYTAEDFLEGHCIHGEFRVDAAVEAVAVAAVDAVAAALVDVVADSHELAAAALVSVSELALVLEFAVCSA